MHISDRYVGLLLIPMALAAGGCRSITVSLHPGLQGKTVQVNVVGLTQSEYQQWHDYSMSQYWNHDDELRTSAIEGGYAEARVFKAANCEPMVIKESDPIWRQQWNGRGAIHVLVLADLPGSHKDKPGNADARRLIFPLEKKWWPNMYWGKMNIPNLVQSKSIVCLRRHTRKEPNSGSSPCPKFPNTCPNARTSSANQAAGSRSGLIRS